MTESTSTLPFVKMQGTGNDFIIIDNRVNGLSEDDIIELAPQICNRRFGIGADGIIALQQPKKKNLDYTMFYRNADGSDAGMCGNGARCLALYASKLGLDEHLTFNVHDVIYKAEVKPGIDEVTVFFPLEIDIDEISVVDGEPLLQVYTGTEHIVKQVTEKKLENRNFLTSRGKALRNLSRFNPPGTNVNFICGNTENSLQLQTYERGVEGLTLACGTGAIASALAWHHFQQIKKAGEYTMIVKTAGGELAVHYFFDADRETYKNIRLTGEAHFVFEGNYLF